MGALFELAFESNVEVDNVVLEDVGERLRVGDDALNQVLVVVQLHLADDWRKRVGQQLDDFISRILSVRDENMLTFAFLGTASDQPFRTAISNANGVNS